MNALKVDKAQPLLIFLLDAGTGMSRTRLKELLAQHAVSVNGKTATRFDTPLKAGDEVQVLTRRERVVHVEPLYGVKIVHEDAAVVVADKPPKLLTIATDKIQDRTAIFAVNDWLRRRKAKEIRAPKGRSTHVPRKQVFIVHRLDRDASGLLVFAKGPEAKEFLQEHWDEAEKNYYALVEGVPAQNEGTLVSYLRENARLRVYGTPLPRSDAKKAVTHYRVLESAGRYTLLGVTLETGRKHQIRVQLSEAGFPIAGDKDYGAKTDPAMRLMLHACRLAFAHPETGERMEFEMPLPESFRRTLAAAARAQGEDRGS